MDIFIGYIKFRNLKKEDRKAFREANKPIITKEDDLEYEIQKEFESMGRKKR